MAVKITSVVKNSLADKAKIKADDILLKINDNEINDVLDYMFYIAEDRVKVEIERNNKIKKINIKKNEYDDIGLEFSSFLMDEKQSCTNKCVFCFIDQMPKGMRETLYFKDDDARLSFLHGNYVTLTNLNDHDIERIIKMHLNINVSVHTTNPELRVKMMNNRFAGEKLKYLKMLADANITMNCQIVLCPELNDGEELIRTLNDLADLYPAVQSIAVVPVGISKFREGLFPLKPFTEKTANEALDIIEAKQEEFFEKFGTRLVYAADEFYLKAKREIPDDEYYEDYPQYENGVGLIRVLQKEFFDALDNTDKDNVNTNISIATGYAASEILIFLIEKAKEKWHNLNCKVYAIKNNYFGENITVAGLITGSDLVEQLKGKELGDYLVIPSVMLKQDSDLFLDDYTVSQVEKELNIKVKVINNDGYELLNTLTGN
jgi:putative radical SAM enzyme (TIGR03279 family)